MHITKGHLPWDYPVGKKLHGGYLWRCPECGAYNAWNHEDAKRAMKRLGVEVNVCSGSAYDNICGACKANIVKTDSPINSECYTHRPDEEE